MIKRPLDYLVSAFRALNADTDGGPALQSHLDAMGQPLFAWPLPDGFPLSASAWRANLLPRWNGALALAGGTIGNTFVNWDALLQAGAKAGYSAHGAVRQLVLGDAAAPRALRGLETHFPRPEEYAALLLMSPPFQGR